MHCNKSVSIGFVLWFNKKPFTQIMNQIIMGGNEHENQQVILLAPLTMHQCVRIIFCCWMAPTCFQSFPTLSHYHHKLSILCFKLCLCYELSSWFPRGSTGFLFRQLWLIFLSLDSYFKVFPKPQLKNLYHVFITLRYFHPQPLASDPQGLLLNYSQAPFSVCCTVPVCVGLLPNITLLCSAALRSLLLWSAARNLPFLLLCHWVHKVSTVLNYCFNVSNKCRVLNPRRTCVRTLDTAWQEGE